MGERGKQFVDVGLGNVAEEFCRLSLQLSHAPDRDVKFDGLRNQRAGCRPDKCWSVRVSKLSRALRCGTLKPRHTPRYQEHRTHSIEEAGRAGGAVVRQPDVCPGGGGRCGWALEFSHYFPGQKEEAFIAPETTSYTPSHYSIPPICRRPLSHRGSIHLSATRPFDDRRPLPTPAHQGQFLDRAPCFFQGPPANAPNRRAVLLHPRGSFIFQPSSCFTTTTTPNRQPRDSCPPPPAWPPMGFRRTFPSPPSWPPSRRCRAQTPQRRRPPRTFSPSSRSRYVNVKLSRPSSPSVHPASNSSTERRMVRHNNDSAVVDGRSGADVRRDHAQGKGTTARPRPPTPGKRGRGSGTDMRGRSRTISRHRSRPATSPPSAARFWFSSRSLRRAPSPSASSSVSAWPSWPSRCRRGRMSCPPWSRALEMTSRAMPVYWTFCECSPRRSPKAAKSPSLYVDRTMANRPRWRPSASSCWDRPRICL